MIPKSVIIKVIGSQKSRLLEMDAGLSRNIEGYEKLSTHAFIITGVRRCGKSTGMFQIHQTIEQDSIYLSFEDPRLSGFDLGDFNRLQEYAEEMGVRCYFFDEIQLIDGWESFVRFRLDERYRIIISGSNASMLSRELGTKLTGRHISRELFPFSYQEYLAFTSQKRTVSSANAYLEAGGFPEFLKTGLPDILMQVFNDIIHRDIVQRFGVRKSGLITQLAIWLISHTGKLFTGNSLRKNFDIPSSSTVSEYLGFFEDAYLFFFIPKFSYSLKVQLANPKKIYSVDTGLTKANSVSFSDDKGRIFENMVFLELRRKTAEIFYFQEKGECDFIVFKNRRLHSICQVCLELNQDNMEREINGLMEAMRFFKVEESWLITLEHKDRFEIDHKTIHVIPFHQWQES